MKIDFDNIFASFLANGLWNYDMVGLLTEIKSSVVFPVLFVDIDTQRSQSFHKRYLSSMINLRIIKLIMKSPSKTGKENKLIKENWEIIVTIYSIW